jgi:hypothetical protein
MREGMMLEMRNAALELQGALSGNANMWADPKKNDNQFGFDVERAAREWWLTQGQQSIGSLGGEVASKL